MVVNDPWEIRPGLISWEKSVIADELKIYGWWFFTNPFEKYATVQLDHFPKVWGGNKKYLKPPPPRFLIPMMFLSKLLSRSIARLPLFRDTRGSSTDRAQTSVEEKAHLSQKSEASLRSFRVWIANTDSDPCDFTLISRIKITENLGVRSEPSWLIKLNKSLAVSVWMTSWAKTYFPQWYHRGKQSGRGSSGKMNSFQVCACFFCPEN